MNLAGDIKPNVAWFGVIRDARQRSHGGFVGSAPEPFLEVWSQLDRLPCVVSSKRVKDCLGDNKYQL
jgi:hypothetical protein